MAAAAGRVRPADLEGKLRISADLGRHADWIREDLEMGFEAVHLYTISGNADRCIDAFGETVLPAVKKSR